MAHASATSTASKPKVRFGSRMEIMGKINQVTKDSTYRESAFLGAFADKLANKEKDASAICQDWELAKKFCEDEYNYLPKSMSKVDRYFNAVVRRLAPPEIARYAIELKNESDMDLQP
jgi:hypothetical protein